MPVGLTRTPARIVQCIATWLALCHVLAGAEFSGAVQEKPCPAGRPPLTQFGARIRDGRQIVSDLLVEAPTTPAVRYIRLRFTLENNEPNWWLVVRNHDGRPINVFDHTSFGPPRAAEGGRRVRWTDRVQGAFARVDLFHTGPGPKPLVRLDEYIAMTANTKNAYYSYQDENNKKILPLYNDGSLDDRRLGDSVGLLFAGRRGMMWACTAVAITSDIVMTNWHCGSPADAAPVDYWSQYICDATLIDFSWDDDERSREFGCEQVLPSSSPALDVVFLKVRAIDRADVLRPVTLLNRPPVSEDVVLIHHPESMSKRITRDCRAVATATGLGPDRFGHKCDSEAGSSGAPVFDASGRVIGIHHEGFKRDETTCERVDEINKAVRIDAVIRHLRQPTTAGGADLLKLLNIDDQ